MKSLRTLREVRMKKRTKLRARANRALPARLHAHNVALDRRFKRAKVLKVPRMQRRLERLAAREEAKLKAAEEQALFKSLKPTIEA